MRFYKEMFGWESTSEFDMGPDGGDAGGKIVATGTPEEVAGLPASHTGRFLADLLPRANGRRRAAR